jgi:S-adenosylmethionine decarboxylase
MHNVPPQGKHLILDIWGEKNSLPYWNMDEAAVALKEAAKFSGVTIITERWHHFGNGCGYTGVIILSESHISVHTWPEEGYAAIDAFYCGVSDPETSLPKIIEFYKPERQSIKILKRG